MSNDDADFDALKQECDDTYHRYRHVVIDAMPDGRMPAEWDAMTCAQHHALADLEAAEQALAEHRARRALHPTAAGGVRPPTRARHLKAV